ncbi:MAG TPA: hypothetical protein VJ833_09915 [Rhodanobacteraceae bacterium]|nr:hypothetical protein [Rhodanobacteraceae bacterium]
MCELTKEAYEADTHQPLNAAEIAAVPTRRTWYAVVGSYKSTLTPRDLTDSHELAKARATIANTELKELGPWHVVVLTEDLRAPG